jgi:two-component system, sensor histidine kinase and response regulator
LSRGAWTTLLAFTYNWALKGGLPFVHPSYMWVAFVGEAICMSILLAYNIETLSAQRQAAEAMAKARSSFLAGMSHEIRTPMTAILGFLTLSLQLGAQGQLRQYLLRIDAAAKHLMGHHQRHPGPGQDRGRQGGTGGRAFRGGGPAA